MKFVKTSFQINRILLEIITSQSFIAITIIGNSIILFASYLFYLIEGDINPAITQYLDAVWWAFATATTVGYGDIIPVTNIGKLLGIALMLIGTALFAIFTAIFAQTIMEDEIIRMNLKPSKKDIKEKK